MASFSGTSVLESGMMYFFSFVSKLTRTVFRFLFPLKTVSVSHSTSSGVAVYVSRSVFRWFKFTLKPPYTVAIGNFFLAIWDTSHWNFFVKFGLKTA